jgi:hypothetical protein
MAHLMNTTWMSEYAKSLIAIFFFPSMCKRETQPQAPHTSADLCLEKIKPTQLSVVAYGVQM